MGQVGAGAQTLPNSVLPPGGHGAGRRSPDPGERMAKGRSSQLRPLSWRAPVPGAGNLHAATAGAAKNEPTESEAARDEAARTETDTSEEDTSSEAAPEVMHALSDKTPVTNSLARQWGRRGGAGSGSCPGLRRAW